MKNENRAWLLLLVTAAAGVGWHLAEDKPRAGTGLAYLLALTLFSMLRSTGGRLMALVCVFGVWSQAAGLACVVWYENLSSKEVGVCDERTGLPVGLIFAAGLLVVAAEFLRGNKR